MTHSFTVITWFTHFGTQLPNRLCQKVHTSARSLRAFSWRAGNLWVNQHWPFLWQRTEIKTGKTIAKWVSFPKIFKKKIKKSSAWDPALGPVWMDGTSTHPVLVWAGWVQPLSCPSEEGWGPFGSSMLAFSMWVGKPSVGLQAGKWSANPGWAQPASRASHVVLAVYFNHHPTLPAAVFFTAASVPFCRAHCRAPLELVLGSRTKQKSIGLCADVEARCIHSAQSLPWESPALSAFWTCFPLLLSQCSLNTDEKIWDLYQQALFKTKLSHQLLKKVNMHVITP